jgi:Na+-transporting NADH:ubiquinone oxidoreductase subunit B
MTMAGLWSRDTIGWLLISALVPPAAALVAAQGVEGVIRIGAVLGAGLAWHLLFRRLNGVPWSPTPAVMAVAMAALAPAGLSPVALALGASFGILLAELIFGGWGRNVMGAPATALAMLYLSHPGGVAPEPDMGLLLASGVSALILLAAGILPLRVLVGAGAGLAGVMALTGAPSDSALSAGGVALGLVFLLCDPVTAPTTKGARLLYGLLGGALLALLAGPEGLAGAARATAFAILLAQVFSSVLETGGLALKRRARERRHV